MKVLLFSITFVLVHALPVPGQQSPFVRMDTSGTSSEASFSNSACWGDFDNDGDLDLFVANGGNSSTEKNALYENRFVPDSQLIFVKIQEGPFAVDDLSSRDAAWGDYDNDGDLDLIVANNGSGDNRNNLYRNELIESGTATFTKIESGIIVTEQRGSNGVSWADYDNDGDLDCYVVNSTQNLFSDEFNSLFRNEGDGTFSKIGSGSIVTDLEASQALGWADFDLDGDLDVFVTNGLDDNALYRNHEQGIFQRVNFANNDNAQAAAWGDFDGDGDADLFVAVRGGIDNQLFANIAGTLNLTVCLVSNDGGESADAKWADYNNDGNLDLFVANDGTTDFLYRNEGGSGCNFVKITDGDLGSDAGSSYKAIWADIDNDLDLDLFVAKGGLFFPDTNLMYLNDNPFLVPPNTRPNPPTGLSSLDFGNTFSFLWNPGHDAETDTGALSYNLRIGTSGGGHEVMAGHGLGDGRRTIVATGNVGHNRAWIVNNFKPGTYYWSVQTIDGAFAGSAWAPEDSFTVTQPLFQPTNLEFPEFDHQTLSGNFVRAEGNPDGYLVVRTQDSTSTFFPDDGESFTPGQTIGGVTIVQTGADTTFSDSGLNGKTRYYYMVFAFNLPGAAIDYRPDSPLTNSIRTLANEPQFQASALDTANSRFDLISSFETTLSFRAAADNPGGYLVIRKIKTPPAEKPVDRTSYLPGEILAPGEEVVHIGDTSFVQNGLSFDSTYFYSIFAFNDSGDSTSYQDIGYTDSINARFAPVAYDPVAYRESEFSASLNGVVGPRFLNTAVFFVYDTRTHTHPDAYASTVSAEPDTIPATVDAAAVRAELLNLDPFETYHFRVVAVNVRNDSAFSEPDSFRLGGPGPTINAAQVVFDETPEEGQPVNITAIVDGTLPEVRILYARNSDVDTIESIMDSTGQAQYEFQIPASFVDQDGLWFQIRAENDEGTDSFPDTGRQYISVFINQPGTFQQILSDGALPNGIPADQYQIVSLPFGSGENFLTVLLGEQKINSKGKATNWEAFEYDAPGNIFRPASNISDEKAYVLYHKTNPANQDFDFGSTLTHSGQQWLDLMLEPGWNLVPWPFGFPSAIVQDDINPVWELAGGDPRITTMLRPFGGYMVENRTGSPVPAASLIIRNNSLQKPGVNGGNGWRIRLTIRAGEFEDPDNFFGVHPEADAGYDLHDAGEPPGIGDRITLHFENPAGVDSRPLAFDIRSMEEAGHIWDVVVGNTTKEKILSLNYDANNLPDDFDLALVDVSNHRTIMAEELPYEFNGRSRTRFKAVAGSSEYVGKTVKEIEAALPDRFELRQNYPNPFNPTTTIEYAVPRSTKVRLEIFNVLGQKIATLADQPVETGRYEVKWDGRNKGGSQVSSGVYFYVLTTPGFKKSRKMLLIK